MCILSIKVLIRKKYGNLFNDPRMRVYVFVSRQFDTAFNEIHSSKMLMYMKIYI